MIERSEQAALSSASRSRHCYVAIGDIETLPENVWHKVKWTAGGRQEYGEALKSSGGWFRRLSSRVNDSTPCNIPSHVWFE